MRRIDAPTLRAWLTDGRELALLERGRKSEFGASHLFWAVPCPFSQREMRARALLPRRAFASSASMTEGLAERLAAWLEDAGCTDVHVLDGGTKAWEAAARLFSGVNVPSKAFGSGGHHDGTESVDAPVLKSWLDQGRRMVVLDSRTHEEFVRMSIPGALSVPGGELAYRIGDLAPIRRR